MAAFSPSSFSKLLDDPLCMLGEWIDVVVDFLAERVAHAVNVANGGFFFFRRRLGLARSLDSRSMRGAAHCEGSLRPKTLRHDNLKPAEHAEIPRV